MITVSINNAAKKEYLENGMLAAWAWAQSRFGDPSLTKKRRWVFLPQHCSNHLFVFSHKKDAELFSQRWGHERQTKTH